MASGMEWIRGVAASIILSSDFSIFFSTSVLRVKNDLKIGRRKNNIYMYVCMYVLFLLNEYGPRIHVELKLDTEPFHPLIKGNRERERETGKNGTRKKNTTDF